MQLLPAIQEDERAGYPSASGFERLQKCRASHLLSRKAHALGQVAHEWSLAADLGTKKHLASTEGPEILSPAEREDWEKVQASGKDAQRPELGWEHINLTGDYVWRQKSALRKEASGRYCPFRDSNVLYIPNFVVTP